MAHNRTRQQLDEERKLVMATKVSFYVAWKFEVFCESCRTYRDLPVRGILGGRRRAGETVGEVLGKLRCRTHRKAPMRCALVGNPKSLRVDLRG